MNSNENAGPTVEIGEANFDREVRNATQPVLVEVRNQLYRHMHYLSFSFHNKPRTGRRDLAIDQLRGIPTGPGGSDAGQGADPRGDVRADVCTEVAVCSRGALGSLESALP